MENEKKSSWRYNPKKSETMHDGRTAQLIAKKFFLVAALAVLLAAPATLALGLSPASVTVDEILRGGYAESSFKVYNTEAEPLVFSFRVGDDIKDWAAVYPKNTFIVPSRQSETVRVVIQPPLDAANGVYNGSLVLEAGPEKQYSGSGAGATIRTGVQGKIIVKVTDKEKFDLGVQAVETGAVEERNPIVLKINFENKGNVRAKPSVKAEVRDRRGGLAKSVENSEFEVLPTRSDWLELKLPTEDLPPGEYSLTVTISTRGQQIFSRTLPVEILEVGSLNRKGEFVEVKAPSFAEAGSFVKIDGVFNNTGTLATTAKLTGEVTLGDAIVSPISSDELTVAPGEQAVLSTFFKPSQPGRHVAKVSVLYSRKKTEAKEVVINVQASPQPGGLSGDTLYITLGVLALLLIAVTLYALRDKLPGMKVGRKQGHYKKGK